MSSSSSKTRSSIKHQPASAEKAADTEHFRILAENCGVGVWHISVTGYTLYLNPAMCSILEIEGPEELAGMTYHSFLTPESLEIVEREHSKRMAGKTSQYEIEIVGKQGGRRHVLVSGAPLFSEEGRLESYIGTFCDVTDRKKAEDALRRSEANYRTLVQTAHDFIWSCDLSGTVTFANKAWRRILGCDPQDIVGRQFTEFLPPADANKGWEVFTDIIAGNHYTSYETGVLGRDGKVTILRFNSAVLRDECGQLLGVMGTAQDVTELKMSEALREEFSRRLLEAIDEERRRIARELHDNVGQSLAALGLQVHALLREKNPLDANTRKALLQISKHLGKAAEAAARLACDHHPVELTDLGISTAIHSLVKDFAQRHSLAFSVCADSVAELLNGERALHLFRIVQEALNNVVKHANATHVRVALTGNGQGIQLSIEDNGRGFDTKRALRQHRGLGLSTMRERVGILKGTFALHSTAGAGTKVEITVPIEPPRS